MMLKIIFATIPALILLFSCAKNQVSGSPEQSGDSFIPVSRVNIESSIEEEGEVAPLKSVEIKSRISGKVTRVLAQEGDTVRKGKVIAEIQADSDQAKSINSTVNDYKDAQIAYENAKTDYDQKKSLYTNGFISETDLRDAKDQYTKTLSAYQAAREEYLLIKNELGVDENSRSKSLSVTSPLSGMVLSNAVEEGELVSGETTLRSGSLLFILADSEKFVARVDINEYDINKVRLGQKVEIRRSQNTRELYAGKVRKIAPLSVTVDNVKVYPVEIEIEKPGGLLRFGMSVQIKIGVASRTNALSIPVTSLFIDGKNREYVIVKSKSGQIEERPVTRGINNESYVEILSGLKDGDLVAGQKINVPRTSQTNRRPAGGLMPGGGPGGGGPRVH